jgi:mannitol-specific phosphotransferase system IIBC component
MSTVESSIDTVYIDIINAGVTATATGGSTIALIVRFTKNLRKKIVIFLALLHRVRSMTFISCTKHLLLLWSSKGKNTFWRKMVL